MRRMTRAEQVTRSRERVLGAAARRFQKRGFHGATLEEIADDAGFSKGVIYSRFGGKDDLFLALLERRIETRVRRMIERARTARPDAVLEELWDSVREFHESDPLGQLLVIEFRVHAARNPALNRRYAALHARALAGAAEMFRAIAARAGAALPYPAADLARLVAALDNGGVLERHVEAPGSAFEISRHAFRLLLSPQPSGGSTPDAS